MSASLVGSEMCIRDRAPLLHVSAKATPPLRDQHLEVAEGVEILCASRSLRSAGRRIRTRSPGTGTSSPTRL
eukprot:7915015-Alexandrium_andersonii.AAC.1